MPLPDLIEIVPLEKPVHAEITVPGSKSITNRALILAALAEGEVTLDGALWSEDTQIMVECLQELGFMVQVRADPNEDCNRTITVYGKGGQIPPGGTESQPMELFVGNAGTAARFLAAFVCLGKGVYRLHGVPRMHERPQAALFKALRELGFRVEAEQGNEKLPVRIFGGGKTERGSVSRSNVPDASAGVSESCGVDDVAVGHRPALPPRRSCEVSIEQSSQFASALLLCAGTGNWEVKVIGENAEESPYVSMTSKLIEAFPHRGGRFQIEPDASSGSYFWGAGQFFFLKEEGLKLEVHEDKLHSEQNWLSTVSVRNWPLSGWQIDQNFSDAIYVMATSSIGFGFETEESMTLEFGNWRMNNEVERHFNFEPPEFSRRTELGDGIMTAITISPFGIRPFRFTDLGRLRVQECERVVALRTELTKCGAKVIEEGDTLTVYPSQLHGAEIETYNDHRMAMCFAILGLKVPGIKIRNPACVKKTFPNFFQKLAATPPKGLGARIRDAKTGRTLSGEELFAD